MSEEKSITLKFDGWELDLFKTASGSLGITVEHPAGGRFVDIFVSPQLEVHHDGVHPNADMVADERAKIKDWALADMHRTETPETMKSMLELARRSWMNADTLLRHLQGYKFIPGEGWRFDGARIKVPPPLPHAVVLAVLEDVFTEALASYDFAVGSH